MTLKPVFMLWGILICLIWSCTGRVYAAEKKDAAENYETEDADGDISSTAKGLLADMEMEDVQGMLDELLGSGSFSIEDALEKMIRGEQAFSDEAMREFLSGLFFSEVSAQKDLFFKLIVLLLLAAVFSGLADAFDSAQIGEISFYVVYLLIFMLLMNSFSEMSASLENTMDWMTEFMRSLAPAYYLAVSASSGTTSATAFYEGVLILIWAIQWILLYVILPGADLYVLLQLVNHLSHEEMLGKMADLLHTAVSWGQKTLLGAAAGLQIIRNLVAPVMDSLKRGLISKAAGALPGVGNAVNMVTELVVTSAVLVRNCLGVAALIILVLAGAGPIVRYGLLSLCYRFLAAVAQPVSDRRIVECLSTMGEGCALLLRILFTAEILCMLALLVVLAGTG